MTPLYYIIEHPTRGTLRTFDHYFKEPQPRFFWSGARNNPEKAMQFPDLEAVKRALEQMPRRMAERCVVRHSDDFENNRWPAARMLEAVQGQEPGLSGPEVRLQTICQLVESHRSGATGVGLRRTALSLQPEGTIHTDHCRVQLRWLSEREINATFEWAEETPGRLDLMRFDASEGAERLIAATIASQLA